MASNDFEDGVWRTVGGRRIFIRDGESLSSAMKKSGKFKSNKKKSEEIAREDAGKKDLQQIAMEAYDNDDITKEELLRDYFDGDKEKMNAALRNRDGGTLSNTAVEAYKNGDISFNELKSEYFDGDENAARNALIKKGIGYSKQQNINSERNEKEVFERAKKDPSSLTKEEKQYVEKYGKRPISDDENYKKDLERYNQMSQEERIDKFISGKKWNDWSDEDKSKNAGLSKAESNIARYEKEAAAVKSQVNDIEQATGSKVKNAFETDLYGNGKETRFMLDDNKWIAHTKESFGQKEDTWSVNELKNGNIESKSYKSYDDMIKNIGGSKESGSRLSKYSKAYEEYKKQHPNTKITLNQFVKYSESIRG